MRNPANRGATAGLSNAAVAACEERFTAARTTRQDLYVANRFGLPPAIASTIAELAFAKAEHWSRRA